MLEFLTKVNSGINFSCQNNVKIDIVNKLFQIWYLTI